MTGTDCAGESLQHLRFERLLILNKVAKWCELDESYWLKDANGKLGNKGGATGCRL